MIVLFTFCRGGLFIFKSDTGVIITCLCWISCGVFVTSPRLNLGSGTLESRLSDVFGHQLGGIL